MTPDVALKVLGVVVVVALAFLVLRRLQAPKARTTRLAITVWAAFGPYDTAENAEDGLYRASRAAFGQEGITEHAEWLQGHIQNFHDWQAEGRFQEAQKMMRAALLLTSYGRAFEAACKEVKAEAVAQGLEAMEWLNKDLEKTGHRLEAVKHPDGTLQVAYKQIWSDEEIQRKTGEAGEAVFNTIGCNLLEDQANQAQQLLAFLNAVYQANMGKNLETPKDVGIVWSACLVTLDKEPDSVVAQTFKLLNDAWTATRSDNEAYGTSQLVWSNNPGCFERHLQRKHGNPLFPATSRIVAQEQIDEARMRDLQDAEAFREDFERLSQELQGMPRTTNIHGINMLRDKIDDLLDRAPAIGGDIVEAVEQALSEFRDALIVVWREAIRGNSEAIAALDAGESFTKQHAKIFRNRFSAQVRREDSPIRGEELHSLLSEDVETIRITIEMMGKDAKAQNLIRASAIKILHDALQNGMVIPQLDEKLQALGVGNPAGC